MKPSLVRNKSGSLWRLAGLLGAVLLAGPAQAAFEPGPWGLYPGGVEQGDPRVCGAPAGNRCWYVDAQALVPAEQRDGTFERPYGSFELIGGYNSDVGVTDYNNGEFVQGTVPLNCGDNILLKGVFRATDTVEATRKMQLVIRRPCGGDQSRPLVIKSWPGERRAIFEGDIPAPYQLGNTVYPLALRRTQYLIDIGGNGQSRLRYVRIENIEFARAFSGGIRIAEHVERAEIIGVEAHHTHNYPGSAWNGGVVLFANNALHQYVVRNSLFHHNYTGDTCDTRVESCEFKNIAGINVLGENRGDTMRAVNGSTVEIRDNVIHNERMGIIQKHTANVLFTAHNNLIYNVDGGFILRDRDNDVHHNIIHHSTNAFLTSDTGDYTLLTARIHNNTVYNSRRLIFSYPEESTVWVNGTPVAGTLRVRAYDFKNNIFHNPGFGTANGVYTLSPETIAGILPQNASASVSLWSFGPNLYSYRFSNASDAGTNWRGTAFVFYRRTGEATPLTLNYEAGRAYLADQTTTSADSIDSFIFGDPLFANPSEVDTSDAPTAATVARTVAALQLTANSPARGSGSGGGDMGALSDGDFPAPLAPPARPRRLRVR